MPATTTFIDGTRVCPVCGSQMARFTYRKNAVSNVAVKTDWEAWKKVTTWTERTYGGGEGYMCLNCYKKRKIRFWIIAAIFVAVIAACIAVGIAMKITQLTVVGVGLIFLIFLIAGSKSGKELYDIGKAMERYANPSQEFVTRLIWEHPEQFDRLDRVYAEKG